MMEQMSSVQVKPLSFTDFSSQMNINLYKCADKVKQMGKKMILCFKTEMWTENWGSLLSRVKEHQVFFAHFVPLSAEQMTNTLFFPKQIDLAPSRQPLLWHSVKFNLQGNLPQIGNPSQWTFNQLYFLPVTLASLRTSSQGKESF